MHYYKRNIGDYAKKAGRLSMLEHGAYTLLIDACYDREQFPTLEEALDWAWARTEAEESAVKFVLSKFFTLIDGVYVQNRIREELAEYKAKAETNARIAQEREEKRKNGKQSLPQENDSPRTVNEPCEKSHESPPNHKPLTNNQEPLLNKKNNASEENLKSKPDDLPSYAKPEKQEPYDNRVMFEMTADWQPTDSIKPLLGRAGLPTDISKLDQSRISDFVNHWFGKPEKKTADGWNGQLVGWLKRPVFEPKEPKSPKKPAYQSDYVVPPDLKLIVTPPRRKITPEEKAEIDRGMAELLAGFKNV